MESPIWMIGPSSRAPNPRARLPRWTIEFAEKADAFLRVCDVRKSPLRLRDLRRISAEWGGQRHHFVAERDFVFEVTLVERLGPHHGRRLIEPPSVRAGAGLDAGQRHSFATRAIGDLPDRGFRCLPGIR